MPDVNNPNARIGQQNIGGQVYNVYGDRKIPKILGSAPFIPELFIGRGGELEAVRQKLFEGDNLLLLVNGQGGIGKTTLAAKYWQRYEADYRHLAWVFAQSSILDALLLLSLPLGLSYPEAMPNEERLGALLLEMRRLEKPCLLVIDNANDLKDLKNYYVALRSCPNFHLLLTTRITKFEKAAFHEIKPLRDDDALALFVSHYEQHDTAENDLLKNIFAAIGHNTLVIELLAKNLARLNNELETRYRLAELLADLQKKGVLALSRSEAVRTAYQAGGAALREETPEAIIGAMYDLGQLPPEESALLAVFAVLPAENIRFDTLKTLLQPNEAVTSSHRFSTLDTQLLALAQKGWLDFDKPTRSFKISPVVQGVVKAKSENLLEACRPLLDALIRELNREVLHLENYKHSTLFARYAEALVDSNNLNDDVLATLCQNIGDFHTDTGDLNKAMQAYQKMVDIQEGLLSLDPDNADFKNGLAISYSKLGDTHTALGNLPQALTYFEQFNQLFEELHEAYPTNVAFKNGLAISYSKLGETHTALGNLPQALTYFEDETKLFEELHEAYPTNVAFKNGLAISYSKLGSTYTALGNLPQALTYFEERSRLGKELHEAYPTNVAFKNGLAISYSKLGETHTALGNLPQALTYFEQDNQLGKELHEAYPTNVAFKNGLAISYSKLGETHTALGNLPQALTYFEQDIELSKELHEAYPTNVAFKNGLAISYSKLGDTHTALGNLPQALTYFEQYNQLEKALHEAYPTNVAFKNGLAISYSKLGETHMALGNLPQALTYFEERSRLGKALHEAYPTNVAFKNGLAISYSKLGETHMALGNLPQALTYFEERSRLGKELHEAYPTNVAFKNGLAISCQYLGNTHTALGNLPQALTYFEQYNQLEKELHEAYPTNVEFKNGLAISYSKLGWFYKDQKKDNVKARFYFEKYLALREELAKDYPSFVEFQRGLQMAKDALEGLSQ